MVSIGYSLPKYPSYQSFKRHTRRLFEELRNNRAVLAEVSQKPSVGADFVININSRTPMERPVITLSSEQIAFLAEINASVSLDGYIVFGGGE